MQCLVLAGGLATRMRPVTRTLPKALVPVGGRPFADLQLAWLAEQGVSDVVYAIGHLGGLLREFAGDGSRWGLRIRYVDEGEHLRGTGGALRLAYDEGALEPVFAVLYGDSYLSLDLGALFAEFDAARPHVLMTLFRNDGAFDRSNARLHDGSVVYDKTVTDPASRGMRHIDYGLSIIDRDKVVASLAPGATIDLSDVYRELSLAGRVAGVEVHRRFYEIGSPEGLAALEGHLAAREEVR